MASEYVVFVSTEPDAALLDASVTWADVQGNTGAYAYAALRCPDFFTTGCSESGTRKKRQIADIVSVLIGQ